MTTIAQPKGTWSRPRLARPAWLTGAVRRLRTGWGWLVARSAPLRGIVLSLVRPLRVVTELGWLAACLGVSTLVAGVLLGWAGAIALALIVIPVVIRTTENMLLLIPSGLREAAYALGAPKWKVILRITLKAARAGVVTGVISASQ